MGDKRVLRMRWKCSEYLDIEIGDTDKCLVLDLFVDLLEGAKKQRMGLPKHPTLYYGYNGISCQVLTDADVMKMFDVMKDKQCIHLAIGSSDTPCIPLQLARGLMESNKSCPSEKGLIVPPSQLHPVDSSKVASFHPCHARYEPCERKIPATTARRKQINFVVGKGRSQPTNNEGILSRIRGRTQRLDVSINKVDFDDDTCVEDEEYDPSDDSVDDESFSMDEDINPEEVDDIMLERVDDGYKPYASEKWEVDEDVYIDRMYMNGELYPENEFGNIKIREWMIFSDKSHFKDALVDYCVQEGFCVVVTHSERKRYSADCRAGGCEWHIHASCLPDGVTWAIKSLSKYHSCTRLEEHNPMASSDWAAKKVLEDVRANESVDGNTLNNILFQKFGVKLKPTSLYKTRELALGIINGGHDTSYKLLPAYCEVIKRTNPGSKAHCAWKPAQELPEKPLQFSNIFISFMPQITGFIQGCRGVIGVDGTHLKGNYGGVLISAIGLDGNNELFPLAYGIYDNESKRTWSSFFWHLKDCLKDSERDNWTIISDRQKGVEPALDDVWPNISRRFCCRHLCANFKKLFPGPLMHSLFWRACDAYSKHTFDKAIARLEKEAAGKDAIKWLNDLGDKECWARYKFNPDLCFDENTSNFVESFNATLGVHRCSPVLTLLEGIRRSCMVRLAVRQQQSERWDANGITPFVVDVLNVRRKDSRTCKVYMASSREFEIHDGNSSLPVSLGNRTCECGQWQISGIPCRHAIKAILHIRESPEAYVSPWFSVQTYKQAYASNIIPITDSDKWPPFDLPEIEPPSMKRRIGRPSRNRRREEGEKRKGKRSGTVQCRKCKAFGHNSRTCKGGLTAREIREQQAAGINVEHHRKGKKQKQTTKGLDSQSFPIAPTAQCSSSNVQDLG